MTIDVLLQVAHRCTEPRFALALARECAAILVDHAEAILAIQKYVDFTALLIIALKHPSPVECLGISFGEYVELAA